MEATPKLLELCEHFDYELCQRAAREREKFSPYQPTQRKAKFKMCQHAGKSNYIRAYKCVLYSPFSLVLFLQMKEVHPPYLVVMKIAHQMKRIRQCWSWKGNESTPNDCIQNFGTMSLERF